MAATGYAGGDPTRVAKAGDTMAGPLVLPGDPTAATQAADKHYVDTAIAGASGAVVSVNGRTGAIVLTGADVAPVAESQVAGLPGDLAAKMPLALAVAKGDLLVATGSATVVRLPVGADGAALVADSTQPAGVRWAPTGGARMAILSGSIDSGNVNAANTGGAWLPIAGTAKPIATVAGDHCRAEYGFLTNAGAGTYYDVGVVVGGSIVRLLNAPGFPPDSGYEGMPETNPDLPNQFFGPSVNAWFTAGSGDIDAGNVVFCLAWKSAGNGSLEMGIDIPVTYNLYNNHQ